jgi:hypothetical protein
VRHAQQTAAYERIPDRMVVTADRGSVVLSGDDGPVRRDWGVVRPALRRRMFRQTPAGLEPLWLWLNEDGMPRDPHGWHHTFEMANRRVAAMGLDNFHVTAHTHRHSFALKWFSIGKLTYSARLGHLTGKELEDFRSQFGDAWDLVQTMLGHRRVETTKNEYLGPFRNLEVEVLLAHAEGFPIDQFMAQAFVDHPHVVTDPLGVSPR